MRAVFALAGIGRTHEARAVGRNGGRGGDEIKVRDLMLVRAIEIHGPNLFVAGAGGGEIDVRAEKRGPAEALEDLGGEIVRGLARACFVQGASVNVADDFGRIQGRLAEIVEISEGGEQAFFRGGIAKRQIVSLRRGDWTNRT